MNQILGYNFQRYSWGGRYSLTFITGLYPSHINTCNKIADILNIPRNGNIIDWDKILRNFKFKEIHLNYTGYFPDFYSKENLDKFIILLNSHLLINIR